MKVIAPVVMTEAMLVSSSLAEADHPEWAAGTSYAMGARVIKAATHRIYESLIAGNAGHDPADPASTQWMDIGPTNRWAMFEEAAGSRSEGTGSLAVTLAPGAIDALAIVDAQAATARVQVKQGAASLYDQTKAGGGTVLFESLPATASTQVIVTLTGAGAVSAGVLCMGAMIDLGVTEAGPGIGITDFSKRTTDDFGVTSVVERGWAKTMTIRGLIASNAANGIQRSAAALRARPTIWIGEDGYEVLAIYGHYKSFALELRTPQLGFLSLTVEGLAA